MRFYRLDPTLVELLSSISLFIVAVISFHFGDIGDDFFPVGMVTYWAFVYFVFSMIHMASIFFFFEGSRLVRALICWISGGIWLNHIVTNVLSGVGMSMECVVVLVLCLACYYAFLVNVMKVKSQWTS